MSEAEPMTNLGDVVAAAWDHDRSNTAAIAKAIEVSEALVERELHRVLDRRWLAKQGKPG